jgi:hypothetical protein
VAYEAVDSFPDSGDIAGTRKKQARGNQKDEREQECVFGNILSVLLFPQAHLDGL